MASSRHTRSARHSSRRRSGIWGIPPLMLSWLVGLAVLAVVGMASPVLADTTTPTDPTAVSTTDPAATDTAASDPAATDTTATDTTATDTTATDTTATDTSTTSTTSTVDPQTTTGDGTTSTSGATGSTKTTTSRLAALAPAAPVCDPGTLVGNFEIDGNTPVTCPGDDDWANKGSSASDGFDDGTQFSGGSKEMDNPGTWTNASGTAPGKDDIGNVYLYNTTVAGDVWSYFGFTRDANTGTTAFDVEYNQKSNLAGTPAHPNRTAGDLLIQLTQNGNKGFDITDAFEWTVGGLTNNCYTVPGYAPTSGWCPLSLPADVFVGATSADGFFAEGALDITALFGTGTCIGDFGTVNIRSRSSDVPTSELKDWVAPQPVNIPGTCGHIAIEKTDATTGDHIGGATFKITPDPAPGASGGSVTVTDNDANVTAGEVADADSRAGYIKVEPVEPDTYTVEETVAPPGYFLPTPATQTKTVSSSGTATFTFSDPRQWAPLTVAKTAVGKYDASYDWSIAKTVANPGENNPDNTASQNVPDGTSASFGYGVTVTQGAQTKSNFRVTGNVNVTNTNTLPVTATLSDKLADNTACSFTGTDSDSSTAGFQAAVPASATTSYAYTCSYAGTPANPTSGTNNATVTWDLGTYPQTQGQTGTGTATASKDFDFVVGSETNKTVTITDSRHTFSPAWTKTWTAGAQPETRTYTLSFPGVAGTCTDYPNTATLSSNDSNLTRTASATATVCVGSNLTVSKNAVESLHRTYDWSIDKSADQTEITVDPATGKATADYTVKLTAGDATDSQWTMSGQITVKNPNQWENIQVTGVTDAFSGGGACSITSPDRTVPKATANADGTLVLDYSCQFDTKPAYDGTNLATVSWDKTAAATPLGSATGSVGVAAADWSKTFTNDVVQVKDDFSVAGDSHDIGSPVTWAAGLTKTFTYSVDLQGTPGQCVPFTNTAWVVGTAGDTLDSDQATVTVCSPVDVKVDKTWVINGASYPNGQQPLGSAVLSLTGPGNAGSSTQGWGVVREGYHPGSSTTISEQVTLPSRCTLVSQQLTSANGTVLGSALDLPRLVMLTQLHNAYVVTNTVDCTSDLTLVKSVANGPASASSWNLTAAGGQGAVSGPSGTTGVHKAVTPGTGYVLSESAGTDAGADLTTYLQSGDWSCDGGSLTGGNTISIPVTTASVTCTVTNATAKLVLKKVVTNTHGGGAVPSDFALTATPGGNSGTGEKTVAGSAAGTSIWVRPGTSYTLSETGPAGYSLASLVCDGGQDGMTVSVASGTTITCTYTNVDKAAYLTLQKVVDNGQTGATHVDTDWLLSAADVNQVKPTVSGHEGDAAVTHGEILPGTYHLAEDGPAGYAAGSWSCTGATQDGSTITVALDQNVVCSITNTAKPSTLTLVKVVDHNGTGDSAVKGDWTLTGTPSGISGQSPVSGPGGASATVKIGSYSLAESTGPSGYTPSAWSCDGGTQSGASVAVALGQDVTCTITNTAVPATWTVEKSSTTTPDPLLPGGVIHYTLQAHHTGGVAAHDVKVLDDLSGLLAHSTLTSALPANASVDGSGMLTWTIATLSDDAVLQFDLTLANDAWDLDLPNAVTSPGSSNCPTLVSTQTHDECTTDDHTPKQPHLTLVKVVDNGINSQADKTWWKLSATPAQGPAVSGDGGFSQGVDPGTYSLSEAAAGQDHDVSKFSASSWSCETTQTHLPVSLTVGTQLTLVPNDDVTCTITNTRAGEWTVAKSSSTSPDPLLPGGTITYTLTATHTVGVDPQHVVLTDDLTSVFAHANSFALGTVPAGTTVSGPSATNPRVLTWTIDDLATTKSLMFTVTTDQDAWNTEFVNAVTSVGSSNCPTLEAAQSHEECTTDDHTPHKPTLTLVKDVTDPQETGDQAQPKDWTVSATDLAHPTNTVTGNGDPSDAGGVNAVEVLPGTFQLAESNGPSGYAPKGWDCVGQGGEAFDAALSQVSLAPDDAVTCTVTNEAIPGTFKVEKASNPASGETVAPGQTITYTVTVTHLTGVSPRNVTVTDNLSDVLDDANSFTVVSTTPAGTTVQNPSTGNGQTMTWTIPKLDTTATIVYSVKVNDDAFGKTLRNVVVAPASANCPTAQSTAPECSTTHPTAKWTLKKVSNPVTGTEVKPLSKITYTLTATNISDAKVAGMTVTDDLSDVLDDATLDAVPVGATLTGTKLVWAVPTLLANGDAATLSYTVTVKAGSSLAILHNVATPDQPSGSCVAVGACETTHRTPEILGTESGRPRPAPHIKGVQSGLPNTGGPDLAWLWSGATLLLAGCGLVMGSRRRVRVHRS